MGNKNAKYDNIKELKNAKYDEVTDPYLSLKRYAAYADTRKEALDNLRMVCKENGIPQPKNMNDVYICGTLNIPYIFKYKKRLNPVWFSHRNGRYVAFVYYYDL